MAARHEEGCYEKNVFIYFRVCKGLPNDYVGLQRATERLRRFAEGYRTVTFGLVTGPVFQDIRPEAWFQNRGFLERKVGRATVERLIR